jgi:hypothetical protein
MLTDKIMTVVLCVCLQIDDKIEKNQHPIYFIFLQLDMTNLSCVSVRQMRIGSKSVCENSLTMYIQWYLFKVEPEAIKSQPGLLNREFLSLQTDIQFQ